MIESKEINTLVYELQSGDKEALEKIYELYSDALYGLIIRIVHDEALAKDILQDSFIKIWKKANTYTASKGSFFTWMLNICRNRSIDELRKIKRTDGRKIRISSTNVSGLKGVTTNVDVIGLEDMVSKLPEKYRSMVEYIYLKGYTQQEVSDEFDIPLGTVKSRLRRALINLRNSHLIIFITWILKNI